ncbi:MAG: hypothetical protein MZU97_00675 [Bacillus subtilis]|nr:hypothetical protein [Bacillus subtilis]
MIATVLGTMFAIGIHSLNKKARSRMVFLNQIPILNADVVTGLSLMLIFKVLMNVFSKHFRSGSKRQRAVLPDFDHGTAWRTSTSALPYVVLSVLAETFGTRRSICTTRRSILAANRSTRLCASSSRRSKPVSSPAC